MTWYLGETSMCNDRELACLERIETSSKPPKTCVLALPNLPLSSPDTHSEVNQEYHTKTPFNLNLNNLLKFIKILTKTGFIRQFRTGLYKTRM